MNCRNIEQLLPLYIEGDLSTEQERAVVAYHLLSCYHCQSLADEYQESQNLLRLHQPPEFDAAFYDGIRRAVLREINGDVATPLSFYSLFSRLFYQRRAFAAAVVLLVVCALAFVIYRGEFNNSRESLTAVSESRTSVPQTNGKSEQPKDTLNPGRTPQPLKQETIVKRRRMEVARRARATSSRSERINLNAGQDITMNPTTLAAPESEEISTSTDTSVSSDGEKFNTEIATTRGTNPDQEVLRIELQTSNPNIRIIWLAPKQSNSPPSTTITK